MNWIESLISFLKETWEFFFPLMVVKEFEGGVILRWGLYHRDAKKGRNWIIPFKIEEVLTVNICPNGVDGPFQSAVTMDGTPVTVRATAIYKVHDVKVFLLEIENAASVLEDALGGSIAHCVHTSTLEEVNSVDFTEKVRKVARKRSWKYGVEILTIQFKTITPTSLRSGVLHLLH